MKIQFSEDKYYNGELKYLSGKIYDIPEELGEATRWLKRGGVEVKDAPAQETVVEASEIVQECEDQVAIEEVQASPEPAQESYKKPSGKRGRHVRSQGL